MCFFHMCFLMSTLGSCPYALFRLSAVCSAAYTVCTHLPLSAQRRHKVEQPYLSTSCII